MIPARLDSKRFPRKIFANLGGKTLLGNVLEAAKKVKIFDEIIVAACSQEVIEICKEHGVKAVLTDPLLPNGTMRIISAIEKLGLVADVFVNWQADEPFITEEVIKTLLTGNLETDIWTLKKEIDKQEAFEPSIVKVVTDLCDKALYFSRSLIPYQRGESAKYYKHIGLYAFTKKALDKIKKTHPTPLEEAEVLEQLRWLENGLSIQVASTQEDVMGIDTEKDLALANILLFIN